MGWSNPPQSWGDLERALSGRRPKAEPAPPERRASLDHPGDDSAPGYSHKRPAYRVPEGRPGSPDEPYVPYAELHVHSDFSFLDGASDPESLIEEAARLRLAGRPAHPPHRRVR